MISLGLRVYGKDSDIHFTIQSDAYALAHGWYKDWRQLLRCVSPERFDRVYVDWRDS